MRVEAEVVCQVLELPPDPVWRQRRVLVENVVGHLFHEPVEALALEVSAQAQLIGDVAHVHEARQGLASVEVLLVGLVEPCLDHAPRKNLNSKFQKKNK